MNAPIRPLAFIPPVLFALLLLPGESGRPAAPVKVATWNVENFFDVFDDPYSRDDITRPLYASEARKGRLAAVLKRLDADVVCLQEVENRSLLEEFVAQYLPESGYEVVHYEGNDSRGIDVALLSRLPVGAVTSYRHLSFRDEEGNPVRFRRDLLRVRIEGPLQADVYVVHLKSQAGAEAADAVRLAEARAVAGVLAAEMAADPAYRAILAGDFNDILDSPTMQAVLATGLVDACCPEGAAQVTYNQDPYRTRIDFILLTPALAQRLQGAATILEDEGVLTSSDHNPVLLTLD